MNTVMSSQNHAMKTNTVKTSTKKLRKVKPSLTNSIAILHVSDAQNGRSPAYSPTPAPQPLGGGSPSPRLKRAVRLSLARLEISQRRETGSSPKRSLSDFSLAIGQSCCGRRASLAHFLSLATRFRSLQGELVSAAVGWAAAACLRSACHRSAGEQETEPHGAWPAHGVPLQHGRRAPLACACDRSLCSPVSTRRRTLACAAEGARLCPESLRLSAPLFRAPHGAFRAPGCTPYRASRANAGATP